MIASDAAQSTSGLAMLAVIQKIQKPENFSLFYTRPVSQAEKLVYATALPLDREAHP